MSGQLIEGEVPVLKPKWSHRLPAGALAMGMAKEYFAIAFDDGTAGLFSIATGELQKKIEAHEGSTLQAKISPSGKLLATTGEDGFFRVFGVADGAEIFSKQVTEAWAENLHWSPERDVAAVSAGKFVASYDVSDGVYRQSDPFASSVGAIAWLGDSQIGAGYYGGLSLLSLSDLKPQRTFAWKGSLISVRFSPLQTYAVCGSQDASIHLWDLKTGTDLEMTGFSAKSREISFHASGDFMANASGAEITVWDFRGEGPSGRKPWVLGPTPGTITSLRYQNRGPLLLSCDQEGVVFIWAPPSDVPRHVAGIKDEPISAAEWTLDDQTVVAAFKNGYVVAYDVPAGAL